MLPTREERVRKRSQSRREQHKQELRRKILEAASALFEEHGYEQFSLRQVAEEVGYTPTTIYRYFKNKDALIAALVLEGFCAFIEVMQTAFDSTDEPLERLRELGRAYVGFGMDYPLHYRLMFMNRLDLLMDYLAEQETEEVDGAAAFDVVIEAVRLAKEAGRLRTGTVEQFAHLLWTTVHGVTALYLSSHVIPYQGFDPVEQAEFTIDILLDGVVP